jgi:hypothetical protein
MYHSTHYALPFVFVEALVDETLCSIQGVEPVWLISESESCQGSAAALSAARLPQPVLLSSPASWHEEALRRK